MPQGGLPDPFAFARQEALRRMRVLAEAYGSTPTAAAPTPTDRLTAALQTDPPTPGFFSSDPAVIHRRLLRLPGG